MPAAVSWGFDLDIGALIALGAVAATLFWRMLARLEGKVDRLGEHMVPRSECVARHFEMQKEFDHHYHIPDDGVAVIKGDHI
jgi:hypothetical protein